MAKRFTYKKEHRKITYLSSKYARLFDAYAYHVFGDDKRPQSKCGSIIVRAFFDRMPEHEQKGLLTKYDEFTSGKYKQMDDGN